MWESCSRVFQSPKYLLGFTAACYEACYSEDIYEFIGSWQGSPSALVVKWADTEKERQARKVQKDQGVSAVPVPGQQQPSLFGAVPMGYASAPPYNGYTYQVIHHH